MKHKIKQTTMGRGEKSWDENFLIYDGNSISNYPLGMEFSSFGTEFPSLIIFGTNFLSLNCTNFLKNLQKYF